MVYIHVVKNTAKMAVDFIIKTINNGLFYNVQRILTMIN